MAVYVSLIQFYGGFAGSHSYWIFSWFVLWFRKILSVYDSWNFTCENYVRSEFHTFFFSVIQLGTSPIWDNIQVNLLLEFLEVTETVYSIPKDRYGYLLTIKLIETTYSFPNYPCPHLSPWFCISSAFSFPSLEIDLGNTSSDLLTLVSG